MKLRIYNLNATYKDYKEYKIDDDKIKEDDKTFIVEIDKTVKNIDSKYYGTYIFSKLNSVDISYEQHDYNEYARNRVRLDRYKIISHIKK